MNGTTKLFDVDGWQSLAMAVIKQAADDYRTASKRVRNPHTDTADNRNMLSECEQFFRSPFPEAWTGANGKYILRKLREEVT